MPARPGPRLFFAPFDLIALLGGDGQTARLMAGHAPLAIFEHEDIGRDETGAAKLLTANDETGPGRGNHGRVECVHLRRIADDENPEPGFHHRVAGVDARPVGVSDGHFSALRPQPLHGLEVGSPERGIKCLIGAQHCSLDGHVFIGNWEKRGRQAR